MLPNETLDERNQRLFNTTAPVAFITGSAAPRVGRRIAEHLLSQNFRVVFHAHEASPQANEFVSQVNADATLSGQTQVAGLRAMLVTGDVQEESNVTKWLNETLGHFGQVDVLVNSAAIWEPKPLEETRSEDYQRYFQVNALGAALCGQHFGLAMTKQSSGGAIINIGDWAISRPYRDFTPYFLSKGSVIALTHSLAIELAQRNPGVRVNAVLPGPIQLAEGISLERRQRIIDDCLLKREGSADDLAQAIVFLATSPFVTGVCLPIDGGRTIWAGDSSDTVAHPKWTAPSLK